MFGSFWSVIAFTRAKQRHRLEHVGRNKLLTWSGLTSEHFGTIGNHCPRMSKASKARHEASPGLRTVQRFLLYLAEFRVLQSVWNNKTQYETMRNMTNPSSWSPFKSCDLGFFCVHSLSGRFKRGDTKWYKMCAWSWMAARSFGSKAVAGVAEVGELSASCAGGASSTLSCRRGFTDGFCTKSGK